MEVCNDLYTLSIAEINTNGIEVCGKAIGSGIGNVFPACVKMPHLNSTDKADLVQCSQDARRNVNEGSDPKFVRPGIVDMGAEEEKLEQFLADIDEEDPSNMQMTASESFENQEGSMVGPSKFIAELTEAPESALVSHLPGFKRTFPSKHYAGYVTIDKNHGKNLYYYFVEYEHNREKDPLVLWLNGDPGCSSIDGFVYEHGPFNFKSGGTLDFKESSTFLDITDMVHYDTTYEVMGLAFHPNFTSNGCLTQTTSCFGRYQGVISEFTVNGFSSTTSSKATSAFPSKVKKDFHHGASICRTSWRANSFWT
ncbi:Serine carboxypeptidase-like 20 [Dendrobium catenatum]|uniref:Serine carboxypeptidase-like 20 n=1 Tax=Dendrobium catenatum TaxID=906689 RepID=A0A2I0VER2_9ASPA|nr:Serine carboxypeptidase-like 20 [Dendrobium catenatum]